MPEWIRNAWFDFWATYGWTYTTRHSKKPTKLFGTVTAYGETEKLILVPGKDGLVPYSHEEISGLAIACAVCGKPIWWSDPVGLVVPAEGHTPEKGSYFYEPEKAYACCFRWDCMHPFQRGFWMPSADDPMRFDILRTAGPDEILAANSGLDGVIVPDVRDINAAIQATNALARSQQTPAPSE